MEEDAKSFSVSLNKISNVLVSLENYFPSNSLDRQDREAGDVLLVLHDNDNAKIIKVTFK
jgi:hypothetical protein